MGSFLILGIVFFSCEKKNEVDYENLIPQDDMVNILVDIHIAESITQKYTALQRDAEDRSGPVYQNIFEDYGVDYFQFDSSLTWYQVHPEIYREMYDEVIIELTKLKNNEEDDMIRRGLLVIKPRDISDIQYIEDSLFIGPLRVYQRFAYDSICERDKLVDYYRLYVDTAILVDSLELKKEFE
jgi:uncharacterized protein YciU (UPF0263 family)